MPGISSKYQPVIDAVKAGGAVLLKYFGAAYDIHQKSSASDLRTTADLESEKVILEKLSQTFPDYNLYSEEAGEINKGSEYTFAIDPLDGTSNFVLGIP